MPQLQAIKGLDSLMDGALNERFNIEWARLLGNVFDPNTDPKAKRSITVTIEVVPEEDRTSGSFKGRVTSKLAPAATIVKPIYLDVGDDGKVVASEMTKQVPGQIDMEGKVNIPNVVNFNREG